MFPFDLDDEDLEATEPIEDESEYTDYEIDFDNNRLTGRIISGKPALIQWAHLSILTQRYRYTQHTWNYGCEIEDLIGRHYEPDYVQTESKRMITEALTVNPDITSVENVQVENGDTGVHVSCIMRTIYGEAEVYV